jgi:hypothetical protein
VLTHPSRVLAKRMGKLDYRSIQVAENRTELEFRFYLPVASRVANRCGKLAAKIFS